MRRRLFTLTSALSLLLCVVTAVLWVRSNSYLDGHPTAPHEGEGSCREICGYDFRAPSATNAGEAHCPFLPITSPVFDFWADGQ
ncbi:MAG TPA: hypothetical protein VG269_13640 [Tepidisphaeraceae bacterium]|nr:hypothetical protein [Tepidisphaeraceae bacterium]